MVDKKIRIAISLLTHNDLELLKPCLDSLFESDLNQHEFKLFIFDNNSNIKLREYLNNIKMDKHIVFSEKNDGIVIPRIKIYNEIIKEEFDFLLEIHSDMIFPKNWLNVLFEIDDDETLILQPHIYHPSIIMESKELENKLTTLKNEKTYNYCRQVHPWLIKIKYVNMIGGYYDEIFSPQECEDDDFVYRVVKNGFKIKSTGKSWVCHYGGLVRNKVLVSNVNKQKQIFENKHNISFNDFLKLLEFHPAFK